MSLSANYPALAPNMLLDFANSKTVDPRITVTRASTATYFNQLGVLTSAADNVPRIDFNPTTYACNGLLVEEQRTNLVLYSADFGNAAWVKVRASISSNQIIAPDGTLTADLGIEDTTASSTHNPALQDATIIANATYTVSGYFKSLTRFRGSLQFSSTDSANFVSADFNLTAGTVAATSGGTGSGATATITNVGNGWYRVTISGAIGSGLTTGRWILRLADSSGNTIYTGDGTSGLYLWGAQLEAGAFATSYIPTVAATVTRQADAISMTGTAFSGWFNAVEGTFVSQAQFTNIVGFNSVYDANDGTTNNRIRTLQWNDGTNRRLSVTDGGVLQASIAGTAGAGVFKFGSAYKVNDFAACQDGGAVGTDTSGTVPSVNQMGIGCYGPVSPTFFLNGWVRRLSYYPLRNTNAQLQALTGT